MRSLDERLAQGALFAIEIDDNDERAAANQEKEEPSTNPGGGNLNSHLESRVKNTEDDMTLAARLRTADPQGTGAGSKVRSVDARITVPSPAPFSAPAFPDEADITECR